MREDGDSEIGNGEWIRSTLRKEMWRLSVGKCMNGEQAIVP